MDSDSLSMPPLSHSVTRPDRKTQIGGARGFGRVVGPFECSSVYVRYLWWASNQIVARLWVEVATHVGSIAQLAPKKPRSLTDK
jgi:hypothetical protein